MTAYRVTARNLDPDADNAIHDDDVARSFGFAGALVPGVELCAYAASAALVDHGEAWLSGGRLTLRFRRPVHDGEPVVVEAGPDGAAVLRGPDGEARSVGWLAGPEPVPAVDPGSWPVAPLPEVLPPPEPASLPVGPLGTVADDLPVVRGAEYARAVDELAPRLREGVLAHPGLLLRAVNLVLMRNVALGPWIHTCTEAVLLAPAPLPARLEVRARVLGTSVRHGSDEVRYEALVLADGVPVLQAVHTALFRLRRP